MVRSFLFCLRRRERPALWNASTTDGTDGTLTRLWIESRNGLTRALMSCCCSGFFRLMMKYWMSAPAVATSTAVPRMIHSPHSACTLTRLVSENSVDSRHDGFGGT